MIHLADRENRTRSALSIVKIDYARRSEISGSEPATEDAAAALIRQCPNIPTSECRAALWTEAHPRIEDKL
jgi:hypothetical protein